MLTLFAAVEIRFRLPRRPRTAGWRR